MSVGNFFKYGAVGSIMGGGAGAVAGGIIGSIIPGLNIITIPLGIMAGGALGTIVGGGISSLVGAFTSPKQEAPAVEVVHVRGGGGYAMAQDVPEQESTRFRDMVANSRGGQRSM